MRDVIFENLYREQLTGYFKTPALIKEDTNPPEQTNQPSPAEHQQTNGMDLEKARTIVAQALSAFTNTLTDKQIGDQDWAQQIFQELGKVMSNRLQDKFNKAPSNEAPKQQAQPPQPTNPQPQATPQNNR